MSLFVFLLHCGPLLGLAAFLASLGAQLGGRLPVSLQPYLLVSLFILLAALNIFRTVSRLNLALFLALSFLSGVVLAQFVPIPMYSGAWLTLIAGIILSWVVGFLWRGRLPWGGKLFFPVLVLYALGWPFAAYLARSKWILPAYSSFGLILFGLLAIWLLSEARHASPENYIPLTGDLFIAYFNIFFIGSLMPGGFG